MTLTNTDPAKRTLKYLRQHKYEFLLLSFLLLIFADTFSHQRFIIVTDIYQNILVGFLVLYNHKRIRYTVILLLLFSVYLDLFDPHFTFINARGLHGIIYIVYFFIVATQVYRAVLYTKSVTRELLAAVLCGFVLLCLMATFLFEEVEINIPGSFTNIGIGASVLKNLNYFSFTTLLTIGYGDITPLSLVAKRAVMLMGLTGHFYTVFVTSIIIGKYLSGKKI